MTINNYLKFWLESSENDISVANDLYKLKKYNYCLFFCHLAIEKLLKGLVYKHIHDHAQPIHNLSKLAKQAELELDIDKIKILKEITSWNIEARYDNYKREFYKKANFTFTSQWFKKSKEIFLWLKKLY